MTERMVAVSTPFGRRSVTVSENWLDRAIRAVAPGIARERLKARVTLALAGSFFGASSSRRGLQEWAVSGLDADSDLLYDLPALRERSRDLERNDPLASGAISTNRINVIGSGLKLNARIDRDALPRLTDEQADAWESAMEREWSMWFGSKDVDIARTLTGTGILNQVFDQAMANGEAVILLPKAKRPNSPYDLRLQVIESDRLTNEKGVADSPTLVAGVEKDAAGAPVAYHIMDQHPGLVRYADPKQYTWTKVPAFGASTGLRNVIHLFEQKRPGQTRGIPYLAPVIESIKMLGRYSEAELMAAVVAGMFTVFITSDTAADDPGPFFAPAAAGSAHATSNAGSDAGIRLMNGGVVGLAPGETISTANPGRPNSAYDPFWTSIVRQIAMGLNIPFEVLIKHFTASYSASRAALLDAWRFFSVRRTWLVENFLAVVYERFVWEAVASGRVSAPGFFSDPAIRAAYLGAEWIGDGQPSLDPLKEANAAKTNIELGLTTRARQTAELNGGDFGRNVKQIAKEVKLLEAAGLTASSPEAAPPGPGLPEEGVEE